MLVHRPRSTVHGLCMTVDRRQWTADYSLANQRSSLFSIHDLQQVSLLIHVENNDG